MMRTPLLIIVVRLNFLVALGIPAYLYHLAIRGGNEFNPRDILIVTVPSAICVLSFVMSFIRKPWSLWTLAIFLTALPLAFWLWFDTSGVVHDDTVSGKAIDWLIIFPAQMLIPVALSYELLTQVAVSRFYSHNGTKIC